jgi:hypothetical protein
MTHATDVGKLIRDLANSMKALRKAEAPIFPVADEFAHGADVEARLVAQYRDAPPPELSDGLRMKLGIAKRKVGIAAE